MLAVVARGLRDLKEQVVFVGGATVDLYVTDLGGEPLRATDDVDCVIEITSRGAYRALEEKLRALKFTHPIDEARPPICRWRYSGILVDIMPTDEAVLGFSNRWYPDGMAHAEKRTLPDGQEIAIFSLPYFLASKIEAFAGRGKNDFYGSQDIEDIVTVIDRADDLEDRVRGAPKAVKTYIGKKFSSLVRDELFVQSVTGHLGPGVGPGRVERVLAVARGLSAILSP